MRYTLLVAIPVLCLSLKVHASAVNSLAGNGPPLTGEAAAAADYTKGVSKPDKSARIAAIKAFHDAKPVLASSWNLIYRTAVSDPDPTVKHEAFAVLAQMPAHDNGVAKMLVAAFDGLKPNDIEMRVAYGKAMNASEFKYDVASTLADEVEKMRWPVAPRGYNGRGPTDKQKEDQKKKEQELKDMLEVFNDVAKSDVTAADKETPTKVKKWWDANQLKFQKADMELREKYATADAEAAKAAHDAKK